MIEKSFHIRPIGGLSNRLRTIDSAISFAKDTHRILTVIWEKTEDFNANFSDLFEIPAAFVLIEIDQNSLLGKSHHLLYYPKHKLEDSVGSVKNILRKQAFKKYDLIIFNDDLDVLYDDIWIKNPKYSMDKLDLELVKKIDAIKHYNAYNSIFITSCYRFYGNANFKSFVPQSGILDVVSLYKLQLKNSIGIHIRRGDHAISTQHSTLPKFIEALKSEIEKNNDIQFFLATDSEDVKSEFIQEFGDRVFSIHHAEMDRDSEIGIKSAVIDLFCLSNTQKIIGSYFSSFSQVAAQIGGVDLIEII